MLSTPFVVLKVMALIFFFFFFELLQHELRFCRLSRTLRLFWTLKSISHKQLPFRSEPVLLPHIVSKGNFFLNFYYSTYKLKHLLFANLIFISDRHIGGNVHRTRCCNITELQHCITYYWMHR